MAQLIKQIIKACFTQKHRQKFYQMKFLTDPMIQTNFQAQIDLKKKMSKPKLTNTDRLNSKAVIKNPI